jgi:uncharacterized protein YuzE
VPLKDAAAMKVTYDPRYNIAYLRFREAREEVETIRLSEEILVDLAPDGTLYGIELLNANAQLSAADAGRIVVVDATGEEHAIPLAG